MTKIEKREITEAMSKYTHITYAESVIDEESPRMMFFQFIKKGIVHTYNDENHEIKSTTFKKGQPLILNNIQAYWCSDFEGGHNVLHNDNTESVFDTDDVILKWYGHGCIKESFGQKDKIDQAAYNRFFSTAVKS